MSKRIKENSLVPARSLTWRKAHGSLSGLGTRQARKNKSKARKQVVCLSVCSVFCMMNEYLLRGAGNSLHFIIRMNASH